MMGGGNNWNSGYGGGGSGGAAKYSTNYAANSNNGAGFNSPGSGGFLSASQGGGFDASPGLGGKRFGKQSLRPVSLKHLARAKAEVEGAPPMLDNEELSYVKIIGRISKASVASTLLKYMVTDGPYSVECVKYLSDSADPNDVQTFSEGTCVKVVGIAKINSKKNVLELSGIFVYPVTNMDEVTYHNLECIYHHLQLTRGVGGAMPGQMTADQSNAFNSTAYANNTNAFQQPGATNHYAHLPPMEAQIMGLLDKYQDGVDLDNIMGSLRSVGAPADIRGALERLENEGHIYDTGDGRYCKTG
ncbi:DNA-directed RNA polymerase I subunit rpa2 [Rhizoclosmatium hyalinum]|nr:DNA-directed RNA polymerase I subunit rpa2 [Rhizoclosmatium hyalinum]